MGLILALEPHAEPWALLDLQLKSICMRQQRMCKVRIRIRAALVAYLHTGVTPESPELLDSPELLFSG